MVRLCWFIGFLINIVYYFIILDVKKEFCYKWVVVIFIVCIFWIGVLLYIFVWMVIIIGYMFGILDVVMGIIFVVFGSSILDCLLSLFIVWKGRLVFYFILLYCWFCIL